MRKTLPEWSLEAQKKDVSSERNEKNKEAEGSGNANVEIPCKPGSATGQLDSTGGPNAKFSSTIKKVSSRIPLKTRDDRQREIHTGGIINIHKNDKVTK